MAHKIIDVTLLKDAWAKDPNKNLWKQNVTDPSIVTGMRIDPTCNADTLAQVMADGCAIQFDNIDGVATAYSLGNAPSVDLNLQLTLVDVVENSPA